MSGIHLLWLLVVIAGSVFVLHKIRTARADRAALAKFLADHNDPRPHLRVIEPNATISSSPPRRAIGPQRRIAIGAGLMAAAIGTGAVITAASTPPADVDSDVTLPGPVSRTGQVEQVSQPMPTITLDRRAPTTQRPRARRPPRTASTTAPAPRTTTPTRTASSSTNTPPAPERTTTRKATPRPTTTPTTTTTSTTPAPTEDTLNHPSQQRGHERKEVPGDRGERKGLISSLTGLIGQIVN